MLKDRGIFAAARRKLGLEEDKNENDWLDGTNIKTNEQVNHLSIIQYGIVIFLCELCLIWAHVFIHLRHFTNYTLLMQAWHFHSINLQVHFCSTDTVVAKVNFCLALAVRIKILNRGNFLKCQCN